MNPRVFEPRIIFNLRCFFPWEFLPSTEFSLTLLAADQICSGFPLLNHRLGLPLSPTTLAVACPHSLKPTGVNSGLAFCSCSVLTLIQASPLHSSFLCRVSCFIPPLPYLLPPCFTRSGPFAHTTVVQLSSSPLHPFCPSVPFPVVGLRLFKCPSLMVLLPFL